MCQCRVVLRSTPPTQAHWQVRTDSEQEDRLSLCRTSSGERRTGQSGLTPGPGPMPRSVCRRHGALSTLSAARAAVLSGCTALSAPSSSESQHWHGLIE